MLQLYPSETWTSENNNLYFEAPYLHGQALAWRGYQAPVLLFAQIKKKEA